MDFKDSDRLWVAAGEVESALQRGDEPAAMATVRSNPAVARAAQPRPWVANAKNTLGGPSMPLLHLAARWGAAGLVQLLLSHGTLVDAGANVLPYHMPQGKPRPGVHPPGTDWMSPLMLATRWGNDGAARALLEGGAALDHPLFKTHKCARPSGAPPRLPPHLSMPSTRISPGCRSALMRAAERADVPTALALLMHGADPLFAQTEMGPLCPKHFTLPLTKSTALDVLCGAPPGPPCPTAGLNSRNYGALNGRQQRLATLLLWVGAEAASWAAAAVLRQWQLPAATATPPQLTDDDMSMAIKYGPAGIRASVRALLLQMHRAGVPRDVEMKVVKVCAC